MSTDPIVNNIGKQPRDNELDLFDLMSSLWDQKWLVIVTTAIFAILAIGYAYLSPPSYEAKTIVAPPRVSDIAPLNLARSLAGLEELNQEMIYGVFTERLASASARQWFLEEHYKPYLLKQSSSISVAELERKFQRILEVRIPEPESRSNSYEVIIKGAEPELVAKWANMFVAEASEQSIGQLKADSAAQIANESKRLENDIKILKASANKWRIDRIAKLTEALETARRVGLDNPLQELGSKTVLLFPSEDGLMPSASTETYPLFMMGSKAILSELELLKQRTSDDPFIDNLRYLEGVLMTVKDVSLEGDIISVHSIGVPASVPDEPVAPNKPLIILFGSLFGCMVGICIATIRLLSRRVVSVGKL